MPQLDAKRFQELTDLWKNDIHLSISSNPNDVLKNEAYKEIIAMGSAALPLILKDYDQNGGAWAVALGHIVGQSPVKETSRGKLDLVRLDWLEWGRKQGLV